MRALCGFNIAFFIIAIFLLNDQINGNPMHSALVGILKKETCLPHLNRCRIYGNFIKNFIASNVFSS